MLSIFLIALSIMSTISRELTIGANKLEMIKEVQHLDMKEQLDVFSSTFENWKGDGKQVDDVLVVGVRF